MLKVLQSRGGLGSLEIAKSMISRLGRKRLLEIYHKLGISEAEKTFILDSESQPYPFLETFIFGYYDHLKYENKIVVDVGAQTGDSVLYFWYRGAKLIHAFEPVDQNYKILTRNVRLNNINCKCYNIGLGDSYSREVIRILGDMAVSSQINHEFESTQSATFFPLDYFRIRPDIVKIDVEGHEERVIIGALETLSETNNVVVETHSKSLSKKTESLLRPLGFSLTKAIRNYADGNTRIEYWKKK